MRRLWWLLAALLLAGCAERGAAVTVWADPALKGALDALAPDFKKTYPAGWEVEYRETAELREASVSAPQVILCTGQQLDELAGAPQLVDATSARTFAGDLLAVVSTKEKEKAVASIGELPLVQFKGLGIGMPDTSVGYYAQQALVTDGAAKPLEGQIHGYADQAKLLAALKGGEVELAIVFASQAAQDPGLHVACVAPENLHEDISYQVVAAAGHAEDPGVLALMRLLTEDPALQSKLGGYGYLDRATALVEDK